MNLQEKAALRKRRILRSLKKIKGTAERPRLCLHISGRNLSAQLIDDDKGHTVCALGSLDKTVRELGVHANVKGAETLGKLVGEKASKSGLTAVVFDRNGRRYHGMVKAFAEAARQSGLQF